MFAGELFVWRVIWPWRSFLFWGGLVVGWLVGWLRLREYLQEVTTYMPICYKQLCGKCSESGGSSCVTEGFSMTQALCCGCLEMPPPGASYLRIGHGHNPNFSPRELFVRGEKCRLAPPESLLLLLGNSRSITYIRLEREIEVGYLYMIPDGTTCRRTPEHFSGQARLPELAFVLVLDKYLFPSPNYQSFISPTILALIPLESISTCPMKKSCTISTSLLVVSKSAISNRRKTQAKPR